MSARPSLACVVLAAGGSRRLGRPRQLVPHRGEPLVRHAVREACASPADHVGVVVGCEAPAVVDALGASRATVLTNAAWDRGMATSLHVAVRWARALGADALLLMLCDQPGVTRAHLTALSATYQATRGPVASRYGETLGAPAVLCAAQYDALLALEGDRGAAAVLRSAPDLTLLDLPEGAFDVDTEDDVARLTP